MIECVCYGTWKIKGALKRKTKTIFYFKILNYEIDDILIFDF